jgi:hypothetical protein
VARVLICEPHDDISSLLELVVRRLGHEPVSWAGDEPVSADCAVIEPGEGAGMRLAHHLAAQDVPIIFTSIFPADEAALALRPVAYLVKPFPLYMLERALVAVLGPPLAAAAAC